MIMKDFASGQVRSQLMSLFKAGALLAFALHASAEDAKLTQRPFQVALGIFTNSSDVTIRADGVSTGGTTIDWDSTFGDIEGTRARLDAYWRITDRHHVRFMYTDNSSRHQTVLDRDIEWNGETIPVNATVTSEFGFSVAEVAYEYDFSKSEDRELVLSAGLHYTRFHADLTGTYTTPGGGGTATVGSEATVAAPLPVIGARGMWNLGGNWWLDGQVQYFQITFGDVDGSLLNYRGSVLWQPKKWFGIGAGYDSFGVDVDVNGDRFTGALDWTYSGPQLFFSVAF